MLKKSFKKLVKKPEDILDEMPLVAALSMENLEVNIEETTVSPLVCKHCGGILTNFNLLEKIKDSKYEWKCEFCTNKNDVNIANIEELNDIQKRMGLSQEELSILFKEISEVKEDKSKDKGKDKDKDKGKKSHGNSLIAIIDISGSMYDGKLEAVKHSLIQTIKDLKVNTPDSIFSLIEFTDHVGIYATPAKKISINDDNTLFSKGKMKKVLSKELKKIKIGPIGEFGDGWVKKIRSLRPMGWTALGPGLYSGQVLIEEKIKNEKMGGKNVSAGILLLTDGLANIGMGRIEGVKEKESKAFYDVIAKDCLKMGIIVDIIGVVKGDNGVALDIIGSITDITGGEMLLITESQIESTMSSLRTKQYIARNTILRVFVPDTLSLEDITGTVISGSIPKGSGSAINLGALDPNRELYLKFKQKKEIKEKSVSIQIQMEYLDKNNIKKTRVIRSNIDTTEETDDYSRNYDAEVYTNYEIQSASQDYKAYNMKAARGKLKKLKQRLSTKEYMMSNNVAMANDLTTNEEAEWDEEAEMAEANNIGDLKSYYQSMGQSRSRSSLSMRKKKMSKKK